MIEIRRHSPRQLIYRRSDSCRVNRTRSPDSGVGPVTQPPRKHCSIFQRKKMNFSFFPSFGEVGLRWHSLSKFHSPPHEKRLFEDFHSLLLAWRIASHAHIFPLLGAITYLQFHNSSSEKNCKTWNETNIMFHVSGMIHPDGKRRLLQSFRLSFRH